VALRSCGVRTLAPGAGPIGRGGLVLRSCAHPPLVSVAVKTYPTYERGQSWEFFDA